MTLLEVALAIALSVTVVGMALGFYRHAVDVRARLEGEMRILEAQARIMDHLTGQLRSAAIYPYLGMALQGDEREIKFVCATLPGPAAWAVRKTTEDPIPAEQDMQLIGYRLRNYTHAETGELVAEGIEQTRQKVLTMQVIEDLREREDEPYRVAGSLDLEPRQIDTALIGPGVRFIAFRYFADGMWMENWSGSRLPLGVELTLGTEPLAEDIKPADYPYEKFRRVIYLPGASRWRPGTIVRGFEED
ncbi:MAG: PulJ/GspJ family protein [Planctomycetota bacterium]|jgi:type II secretory pathway component PulJ